MKTLRVSGCRINNTIAYHIAYHIVYQLPCARCPLCNARCPVPTAPCPVPGARCPCDAPRLCHGRNNLGPSGNFVNFVHPLLRATARYRTQNLVMAMPSRQQLKVILTRVLAWAEAEKKEEVGGDEAEGGEEEEPLSESEFSASGDEAGSGSDVDAYADADENPGAPFDPTNYGTDADLDPVERARRLEVDWWFMCRSLRKILGRPLNKEDDVLNEAIE